MKQRLQSLWSALCDWFCWHAWNYAREREIARRRWYPQDVQGSNDDLSPDQRRIIANEARQVLENKHFVRAFATVHESLEAAAHACDSDNKDKTQRIIIAKQLLQGVRRVLIRQMEDGYMAEAEIVEIEKRRRPARFQR